MHVELPKLGWKRPGAQSVQAELPWLAAKRPGSQSRQFEFPVVG